MKVKTRSRLTVFCLSFLVWVTLTNIQDVQEIIAGLCVSALVALVAGHFLFTAERKKNFFKRFLLMLQYLGIFFVEMVKANLHVAYLVLHPFCPIKPGIVKIKTRLKTTEALTVLTSSITLTPGTLTVDINPGKGDIYIHWIDVLSTDSKKATEAISGKFEGRLAEVFE
jgi:multicomponent Na+:H+ antiporter subunit E